MNVNFSWDVICPTTVVLDSELIPNTYSIKLFFITNTEDLGKQKDSFDAVKEFFISKVNLSCIVGNDTPEFEILTEYFTQVIIQAPGSGMLSDLDIGYLLFQKTRNIVKKNLILTELQISSHLGDNITYSLTEEETVVGITHPWIETKPWWERGDLDTNDLPKVESNIVQEARPERKLFVPIIIQGGKNAQT